MATFWQHGFEGTTMATLTAATGLNKPSLYAAFGSKEEMFRTAFARYRERQAEFTGNLLADPSARVGIEKVLLALVDSLTQPGMPHGCLMVHGCLVGSADSAAIREELQLRRKATETRVRERLKQAQADGEFASAVDVADFARYVGTLFQGLAVQAAGGAPRKALHRVVKLAMMAWPVNA